MYTHVFSSVKNMHMYDRIVCIHKYTVLCIIILNVCRVNFAKIRNTCSAHRLRVKCYAQNANLLYIFLRGLSRAMKIYPESLKRSDKMHIYHTKFIRWNERWELTFKKAYTFGGCEKFPILCSRIR